MPQYKLMYFNSRGRAESARMLFALKGQAFEDYRFKEGEWPGELKANTACNNQVVVEGAMPNRGVFFQKKGVVFHRLQARVQTHTRAAYNQGVFPLGQAPVLIVDGKAIPHSKAICQHLAREFGLYGGNNTEACQIDVIDETVGDIVSKMVPLFFEKDEAKKKEAVEKLEKTTTVPFMTYLENAIKKAGGRFFVGKSETLADVSVYNMMSFVHMMFNKDNIASKYPALTAFHKGITDNSKLSDYIKNRPESAM